MVVIQTRLSTCHINLEWPSNTGVLDNRPLTLWSLRLPGHTGHAHCTTTFILCGPRRPAVIHIPYPSAPNSCCPGQGTDPPPTRPPLQGTGQPLEGKWVFFLLFLQVDLISLFPSAPSPRASLGCLSGPFSDFVYSTESLGVSLESDPSERMMIAISNPKALSGAWGGSL